VATELTTGIFETTLDDGGRAGIPAKLRDRYSGELVITNGIIPGIKCAWVMQPTVWEKMKARFESSAASLTLSEYQTLRYLFITPAQIVEIDKFGRLMVPAAIRTSTGLTKDCMVLSDVDHLEIWNTATYQNLGSQQQQKNSDSIDKMGSLRLFDNAMQGAS
jgi:MraZ protein